MITSAKNPKVAQAVRAEEARLPGGGRTVPRRRARRPCARPSRPRAGSRSCSPSTRSTPWWFRRGRSGAEVHLVSEDVMGKLTSTVTPQGLVGVVPSCRRGPRGAPVRRVRGGAARGPRPRERRHGAPVRGRRRRRRRCVHRDLGRRLQPQDRPRVGRLAVPPAGGPRRHDGGRRSTTSAAPDIGSWRCRRRARATSTSEDLAWPVAFVFGNEAHGLPDEVARAGRRRRPRAARGACRVAEPRGRRHRVPVRMGAPPAQSPGARPSRRSWPPPPTTSARPSRR